MVSTYITECGSKGPASQPVSHPVSRSICTWQKDRLTSASQSVCLYLTKRLASASQPVNQSVLDRQTDLNNIYIYKYINIYIYIYIYIYIIVLYNSLNDLFLWRRYKNIRKRDSTYITKYRYNGPVSHSVCLSLTDRRTSANQSVCLSLTDRLT